MRFEKVSFEEFRKYFNIESAALEAYDNIRLPQRATPGSAGYDFFLPTNYCVYKNPMLIPTGVRVFLDPDYFLMCVPRSGLGFKHGFALRNTTGIIDHDFIYSLTEGHILASVTSDEPVSLNTGDRFMQGIFLRYGLTEDDCPMHMKRNGGIGSTGG
jgi:dUTP pyrophosphatase